MKKIRYINNEALFDTVDSELSVYLLGIMATDGYVLNDGLTVGLSSIDEYLINLLKEALDTNYWTVVTEGKKATHSRLYSLNVRSEKLVKALHDFGLGNKKTLIAKYTSKLGELERHYVRGLFDGDGSVHHDKVQNTPRCSFTTASANMLAGFCNYLSRCDINYSLDLKKNNKSVAVRWSGVGAWKFAGLMYANSEHFLSRKRNTFASIAKNHRRVDKLIKNILL